MGDANPTPVVSEEMPTFTEISHLLDLFDSLVVHPTMMCGWEATMKGATLAGLPGSNLCIGWDDGSADAAVVNLFIRVRHQRILVDGKVYRLNESDKRWHRCKK